MPVDLETYLPVVLAAGKGNRMPTLTEHVWKPLLPVANLPLFWFPLNLLRRNGFKDCILVVPKSERANIERKLKTPQLGLEGLNIQIEAMDEEEAEDGDVEELGTADVVRMLLSKSKIKKPNVLFVSGDLVTDLCMDGMLKFHEEHNSMFTCLLSDFTLNGTVPGTKERQKKYRDLVIYSPESSQLLYMLDEEDYGQEESLPCALFRSASHALATAAYKDVHLYIFKREALTILSIKKDFTFLKADLVPFLLNDQFSKSKRRNSSPNEPYKCFAYLCTKQDCSMLAQCNHTGAYFEANKTVHRLLPKLHDNKPEIVPRVFTKESGVNCSDSWVSESAKVGTKCQIKRSIIGDNCELGQAAKVDNSVIMAGTQVQAGATIKNCIVFNDVNIGEKADLGMCIVAPGQKVQPKVKLSSVTVGEEREMDLGD